LETGAAEDPATHSHREEKKPLTTPQREKKQFQIVETQEKQPLSSLSDEAEVKESEMRGGFEVDTGVAV
jgi:hypothetical protein